jgi:perosamine synthetase
MSFIPLSEPWLNGREWQYVKDCLDSGWVSSAGGYVERFERELAAYVGRQHAVATVNGTAALHIALMVAGVRPDEEVLVSSLTFIASANVIRYAQAWPVFIDAEPHFWQMDSNKLSDFIELHCVWLKGRLVNKRTGRKIAAIMPVHVLGHPVDIDPILELATKFDLPVIEDATEGLGSEYKSRKVGCLGDIACFSFNGNKMITTGGGGMIVTDRQDWQERAKYLVNQAKDDMVEYVHGEIGFNYRLSNIQAAMGCAQLEQLDDIIASKRRIAECYSEGLKHVSGISALGEAEWAFSTFWLYSIAVDKGEYGMGSRSLMKLLTDRDIQSRPIWQPMHMSPAHTHESATDCSIAENLYETVLSLPCSVGLGENQERVIEVIRRQALGGGN